MPRFELPKFKQLRCEYCYEPMEIPVRGGTRRKYCSARCRSMMFRLLAMERQERRDKRLHG